MSTSVLFRTLGLAAALGAAAASQAVTFSDDFGLAQGAVINTQTGFNGGGEVQVGPGAFRHLTNNQTSNSNPGEARSRVNVANGAYNLSNDVEVGSISEVIYRFEAPIDLSGTTGFRLDFLRNDAPSAITIRLYDNASGIATFSGTLGTGSAPFSTTLTQFSPGGDLSKVVRLDVFVNDTYTGQDLSLDKIQSVPEPASLAALGVGAIGLLRRRKRA